MSVVAGKSMTKTSATVKSYQLIEATCAGFVVSTAELSRQEWIAKSTSGKDAVNGSVLTRACAHRRMTIHLLDSMASTDLPIKTFTPLGSKGLFGISMALCGSNWLVPRTSSLAVFAVPAMGTCMRAAGAEFCYEVIVRGGKSSSTGNPKRIFGGWHGFRRSYSFLPCVAF